MYNIYIHWGYYLISVNNLKDAREKFEKAREIDPEFIGSLKGLEFIHSIYLGNTGHILLDKGDLNSAEIILKKSLFYFKDNYNTILNLAKVYYYNDKHEKSINLCQTIPEDFLLYTDALEVMLRSYYQIGIIDSTLYYLNKYFLIKEEIPKDVDNSLLPMLLFGINPDNQSLEILYLKDTDNIEIFLVETQDVNKYKSDLNLIDRKKIFNLNKENIEEIKDNKEIDAKSFYACLLIVQLLKNEEIQKSKEIFETLHNKKITYEYENLKYSELIEYSLPKLFNIYSSLKDSLNR